MSAIDWLVDLLPEQARRCSVGRLMMAAFLAMPFVAFAIELGWWKALGISALVAAAFLWLLVAVELIVKG